MFAGAPGSVAAASQLTVAVVLCGAVKPPLYVTVYVFVQSAVVVPSHAV
jgi:hypothetical protein